VLVDLTVKNYRCFPDTNPARLAIRPGFTVFVGQNNSGKSALLKFFYEFRGLFSLLSTPAEDLLVAFRGQPRVFPLQGVLDLPEIFSNSTSRDLSLEFQFSQAPGEAAPTERAPRRLVVSVRRPQNVFTISTFETWAGAQPARTDYSIAQAEDGHHLMVGGTRIAEVQGLFSALAPLASTTYLAAFRNAVNIGGNQNYYDIQVGENFLRAWKTFKSGNNKQHATAAYNLTQDIKRIFGFDNLEINTADDDQTLQALVDGRPFRLDELGSGLSQFILVLANVATRRRDLILIDEPELNLHPTLQMDFLTTLASYAPAGVLFGTHSMGLARSMGEHVYGLRRIRQGESHIALVERMPRLAEFLGELSFSGYRELGFQTVLLVEGVTDIPAVQEFIRKRGQGHKMVVLHLGGSAMITGNREAELAEICRISPDVRALIDSERGAAGEALSPERAAFVASCGNLNVPCHVLERRALENYFSDRAIKVTIGPAYGALPPYARLRDTARGWPKADNWRIAREMILDELLESDLRTFIDTL
jgi:predicted ATPase